MVESTLRSCKDCGTSDGMDWWVGRHAVKANGNRPTAAARCHGCYNNFHRLRYRSNPDRRERHRQKVVEWRVRNPGRVGELQARQIERRRKARGPRVRYCLDCGELFDYSRRATALRCQDCTYAHNAHRRHESEARRREVYRLGDKSITWRTLGDRDGWCCHLCGKSVPKIAGVAVRPMGATIDHLVPVAHGGAHEWDNVALAHRICNMRRSDRGVVQLRLVG